MANLNAERDASDEKKLLMHGFRSDEGCDLETSLMSPKEMPATLERHCGDGQSRANAGKGGEVKTRDEDQRDDPARTSDGKRVVGGRARLDDNATTSDDGRRTARICHYMGI